jgi:hypothetical protein
MPSRRSRREAPLRAGLARLDAGPGGRAARDGIAAVATSLDLEHLAEEVADLGHSERDAVRSQVRRVIEHLLKLEYSPATEPRDGWKDIVADVRSGVEAN